eukprot:3339905-Prymnesium_polylepis.1
MPEHAADPHNLPYPTLPHKAVRGARARSSQQHLHIARLVVVEAAGPVSGVTIGMVQLRSAVEEVVGDVLHDVHRRAAGHRLCSAACEVYLNRITRNRP